MRKKLDIIYQDKSIIVINKEAGLLTVASDTDAYNTLFNKVLTYEKQKHKSNKIFIVHRLDKDTSGVIVFAKSIKVKNILQDNWDDSAKTRNYIAIVEGVPKEKEKTIKSWLKETSTYLTYSSNRENDGKLAITKYKIIKTNKNNSVLEIKILTGRKNQIRVHLSDIGHPILGDKKYGSKVNPLKRLALHANKLELIHPITKELMIFETNVPNEFSKYL